MATIIPAYVTDDARRCWPKFFAGLFGIGTNTVPGLEGTPGVAWNPLITHFKVGTGGWIDQGNGVKTRRLPSPNLRRLAGPSWREGATTYYLQDIDTVVDADRASSQRLYTVRSTYQKQLTQADLTYEAPNILRVRCLLDFEEFNDDGAGAGASPEIWEVGVFAAHPTVPAPEMLMVAYATFPKEVKTADKQIENIVKVQF